VYKFTHQVAALYFIPYHETERVRS